MNNVNEVPLTEEDIDDLRYWAKAHMEERIPMMSRTEMSRACGIPLGTLGPWLDKKYKGPGYTQARQMLLYKQQVEAKKAHDDALPIDPGFFETETSQRIERLLSLGHTGRITVGGTGPGTGKSQTAKEYSEKASSVVIVTMAPSTRSLAQMIHEVLFALDYDVRRIAAADGSREIIKRVSGRRMLLVFDEANHMSLDSLEEVRRWNELTGVGICLLGNEELIQNIRSGKNKTQLGRLNSRIAWSLIQDVPTDDDVRIFCDHWGISDTTIRKYLRDIATTKDSGGLREARQLIEIASLFAGDEDRGLTLEDLKIVQSQRASRYIRA